MLKQNLLYDLNAVEEFFDRSTHVLQEQDSAFRPTADMMSVAGQVAHAAQTIDWFMEGAFRPEGFDMDFAKMMNEVNAVTSLTSAREGFSRAVENARKTIDAHSEDEWVAPLPAGPIMGGLPRFSILSALNDHTAHHRGALTVYSRLLGKVPAMPYM